MCAEMHPAEYNNNAAAIVGTMRTNAQLAGRVRETLKSRPEVALARFGNPHGRAPNDLHEWLVPIVDPYAALYPADEGVSSAESVSDSAAPASLPNAQLASASSRPARAPAKKRKKRSSSKGGEPEEPSPTVVSKVEVSNRYG